MDTTFTDARPRAGSARRRASSLAVAAIVATAALPGAVTADTAPTLSSLTPNTVSSDADGVVLRVAGDGVGASSTLQWRGADYDIDFIVDLGDGGSLGAVIPGTALSIGAAFETVLVRVTSGDAVSNPQPVTILGPGVSLAQSAVGGAGGSVSAATNRLSATYMRAGAGFGTVTVADYFPTDPTLPPSPISPVAFVDLQLVGGGVGDTIVGTFLPPSPILPPNPILPPSPILPPNPIRLAYWTGNAWAPVLGSGGVAPTFSFDRATTTASSATVTFDMTSAPSVTALGGTVFAFVAAFALDGFFAPIANNTSNVARAGRVIPVKWRVLDLGGNAVAGLTSTSVKLTSVGIGCGGIPTESDPVEAYAPGASGLRSSGDGYYAWNWATDKAWAGTCRVLRLDLGDRNPDGTPIYRTAAFQFTK